MRHTSAPGAARLMIVALGMIAVPTALIGAAGAFQPAARESAEIPRMGAEPSAAVGAIESYASAASGDQAAILADRSVSPSEYRRAATAATACLHRALAREASRRDLALTTDVSPLESSADGFALTYTYSVRAAPGEDLADLPVGLMDVPDRLDATCRHRHLDYVEMAFRSERLADTTYMAAIARDFRGCAEEAGTPLPTGMSVRAGMVDVVDTLGGVSMPAGFARCIEDFPAVTDVPPLPVTE